MPQYSQKPEEVVADMFAYGAGEHEVLAVLTTKYGFSEEQAKRIVRDVFRHQNNDMSSLDELIFKEMKNYLSKKGIRNENNDKISGGLADSMSISDLAEKHNVSEQEITAAIQQGIEVELEHTGDKALAKEIAMDHIYEDPKYYTKLSSLELENADDEKSTVKGYSPILGRDTDSNGISQEDLEAILMKIVTDIEEAKALEEIQQNPATVSEETLDDNLEVMNRGQLMEYVHKCIKDWKQSRN